MMKARRTCAVCKASSLVGRRMRPRIPTIVEWACNFAAKGMIKAAVFPEPVLEQAITSWPARIKGIA